MEIKSINNKSIRRTGQTDFLESLAEELRMNGFPVKIKGDELEMDCVFGEFRYEPTRRNFMYEFYRFIMIYGGALQRYGQEGNGIFIGDNRKKHFK